MATTTTTAPTVQMIALQEIRTDQNVRRRLASEEIDQLAQSIALLGQLTPISVKPHAGGGYVLIAGHKRYAALTQLGQTDIRAEIRSDDGSDASERAAENIVRSALNPQEEAIAVKAMRDRGLTIDGAAQALGWPRQRVTARTRLLELPDAAQEMLGDGLLPLSCVDQLLAIGRVSAPLLGALIEYLGQGNEFMAARLAREPGWVLDAALLSQDSEVFAEPLSQITSRHLAELKLGKRADALLKQAEELAVKLDRYSYGATVAFSDEDIDQARAAGVLVEFDDARSTPVITDRGLYRDLCRQALKRTVGELEHKLERRSEERAAERQAARAQGGPADPGREAEREHRSRLREIAEDAHGANLDLGRSLINGLACVDPDDIDVARFFVYALLQEDYTGGPYEQAGQRVHALAMSGVRLIVADFRCDVTKNRKDGSRGALRIDYGDPHRSETVELSVAWMWKFIDGAKTAGELYGRALVVIAAEQHASRLVLLSSQQRPPSRWSSHKDRAARALTKLAKPHLPASLAQIQRAVERAHRDQLTAQQQPDDEGTPAIEATGPEPEHAEDTAAE